ncbi:fibroblast growth factor-binding protein 2b [Brachyhypopomus gauderio]|uniref:fibroblast growth factor-binding protein 2b n=1 Tax=Brachyhypopomus gauderio TaxID=698409 RepID=UPI004041D8B6
MRPVRLLVLLMTCCVWAVCGQGGTAPPATSVGRRPDPPAEPLRFNTKAKDACTMAVSGQGLLTKLRVTCKSKGRSYWCEYLGRPDVCRPYNANPRHYFTQIMWDLRKLPNACQGQRSYKPRMCHAGPAEAQMTFHRSWPRPAKPDATARPKTAKPPKPAKPAPPRKPVRSTAAAPTQAAETSAGRLAQEYCWQSLQGVCTYVISWFQN